MSVTQKKETTGGPDQSDSGGKTKLFRALAESHKRRNPVGRFHAGI